MSKRIVARIEKTMNYYRALFEAYGPSPEALGWHKGRQMLRFGALLSQYRNLKAPTILDVGCGFGDLNLHLGQVFHEYDYTGIDLLPEFISTARERYGERENVRFMLGDFLSVRFRKNFDVVVASGTFNNKLGACEESALIQKAIEKAFRLCNVGIAFDFLSDKVDYTLEHTHHSSPEQLLRFAYSLSRNLVLLNDYIPFEFCLIIRKDNAFSPDQPAFENAARYLS